MYACICMCIYIYIERERDMQLRCISFGTLIRVSSCTYKKDSAPSYGSICQHMASIGWYMLAYPANASICYHMLAHAGIC